MAPASLHIVEIKLPLKLDAESKWEEIHQIKVKTVLNKYYQEIFITCSMTVKLEIKENEQIGQI